jgi:hypothetical protein
VNYAGYAAARSAVVYVPRSTAEEPANEVANLTDPGGSEKLAHIHASAVWAVLGISDGRYEPASPYTDVLASGLEDLLAEYDIATPGWVRGYLGRKLAYATANTEVELAAPADGQTYAEHEDLHVTVRHNLYLSVPYAAWLMTTLDSDHAVDFGEGRYALRVDIPCVLTNEGVPDTIDLQPEPETTSP